MFGAATSLLAQAEPGVSCPLTMTFAAVPALEASPDVAAEWMPLLRTTEYVCFLLLH